ncbi:POLG alternative reading frame [Eublepharis macularius]|uniref:POLG alternative reading frame n=1 Tax=Eublepharis macularius TaxID=481883 RepID=A0AA97LI46_EUBMA|nr:POLG alternative reading frame [Eublepharis macularius]
MCSKSPAERVRSAPFPCAPHPGARRERSALHAPFRAEAPGWAHGSVPWKAGRDGQEGPSAHAQRRSRRPTRQPYLGALRSRLAVQAARPGPAAASGRGQVLGAGGCSAQAPSRAGGGRQRPGCHVRAEGGGAREGGPPPREFRRRPGAGRGKGGPSVAAGPESCSPFEATQACARRGERKGAPAGCAEGDPQLRASPGVSGAFPNPPPSPALPDGPVCSPKQPLAVEKHRPARLLFRKLARVPAHFFRCSRKGSPSGLLS